tara:strand:+ start:222 stop:422 length:201 start_codon:yes stop_codon:yes gene_type:complete
MVSKKRHILKALTWRLIASVTTFLIGWIATGDIRAGLSIGVFDFSIKLVLYYIHERVWYKSKYGIE